MSPILLKDWKVGAMPQPPRGFVLRSLKGLNTRHESVARAMFACNPKRRWAAVLWGRDGEGLQCVYGLARDP